MNAKLFNSDLITEYLNIMFSSADTPFVTGKALSLIADDLKISKIIISYTQANGEVIKMTIFDKLIGKFPIDGEVFKKNLDGQAAYKIYRTPDTEKWDDDELKFIDVITKIQILFWGKYNQFENEKTAMFMDLQTNLPNLKGFQRFTQIIISKGLIDQYSCLFMNVSKFKLINKLFGYQNGNIALNQIAAKITAFLGSEQIFARLGGDNFVALVKNENLQDFINLTLNINLNFEKSGVLTSYNVAFYGGVYKAQKEDNIPSIVIDKASIAFNINRRTKNINFKEYDYRMHEIILKEKEIEANMQAALANHEFVVYYQPKVNLNTYKLIGAEALVRWQHNDKLIPPDSFIPIFERNGFVCEIDFFVLDFVCSNIRKWIDNGITPVTISVNFSKVHLQDINFVNRIINTLEKHSISSEFIEIEFTETSYIDNSKTLITSLSILNQHGIRCSMDDFGTGFSSLNLLKDIHIDVLKLDKAFLDNTTTMKRQEIIIQNIIRMAKELDIEVISEGVETKEQAKFLNSIDCDMAQGYLFDKPLPIDEFVKDSL